MSGLIIVLSRTVASTCYMFLRKIMKETGVPAGQAASLTTIRLSLANIPAGTGERVRKNPVGSSGLPKQSF